MAKLGIKTVDDALSAMATLRDAWERFSRGGCAFKPAPDARRATESDLCNKIAEKPTK
jgi:hypothetical protein